jgi:hypothetical protein
MKQNQIHEYSGINRNFAAQNFRKLNMAHTLNFIDLFAGAGGLSEGFIRAGYTPLAHIEMDKYACDTLKTRAAFHWLNAHNQLQTFHEEKAMIARDLKLKTDVHKYPFRLYDDDGELYYERLSVENNSFEPLDEEQPNSGVTEIHYFNNGKWEQL